MITLLLPKYIIYALVFAGVCAVTAAYLLDWLATPLRTVVSLMVIAVVLVSVGWVAWPLPPFPKIVITGYEIILFKPHQNPFANVFVRNIGGSGTIAVYSSAIVAPTTIDSSDIKKRITALTQKTFTSGGGPSFDIKPQEGRWFTVMGPPLNSYQLKWLRDGKYSFYFGVKIVNGFDGRNYDFCGFVEGNRPKVVLQCSAN